jgi:hypothetical protein
VMEPWQRTSAARKLETGNRADTQITSFRDLNRIVD